MSSTNETTELLPCPFCGGPAHLEAYGGWCQLRVKHESNCFFDQDDPAPTATDERRAILVAAWNRRAALPTLSAEACTLCGGIGDISDDGAICPHCDRSGIEPAPAAPAASPDLDDALSAVLWLYHRLPRGYDRQSHIERVIKALAAANGSDADVLLHDFRPGAAPVADTRAVGEMATVIAYLNGEGPLDGFHFGERNDTQPGSFWWRKHLMAAWGKLNAPATPTATADSAADALSILIELDRQLSAAWDRRELPATAVSGDLVRRYKAFIAAEETYVKSDVAEMKQ